jgi:general secretion pathway protein G
MKTHPSSRIGRGFTLIELLVVITIIAILAGLSLGGYSYVIRKQADEQARVQISLLEKAIEDYKLDNGEYPASATGTTGLYEALYKKGLGADPVGKIYIAELDPNNQRFGWIKDAGGVITIVDPYQAEYIYRRGDDPLAKNPDFDLASPGKDGILGNADDIDNY